MSKHIKITGIRGKGKYAIVDECLYDELSKFSWHLNNRGYALRTANIDGKTTRIYMHRYVINSESGTIIDHINGDKLDNRLSNLRKATHAQNVRNSGIRASNTSGYKGVSWRLDKNKWQAKITHNFKQIHIGLYDCKHEAAKAYNAKAYELQGDYAQLNVINDDMEAVE